MTLRSTDLQSDGDLDSICNSCDVFIDKSHVWKKPVSPPERLLTNNPYYEKNFPRSSSWKHCFSSRIASPSFLLSDESLFVKTHPFPFWLIQFDHFLIFKIEWSAREQTTFLFFFPYIFSQLYSSTFHSFTLKVKVITSAELMPSPLPQYKITFPSDAAS